MLRLYLSATLKEYLILNPANESSGDGDSAAGQTINVGDKIDPNDPYNVMTYLEPQSRYYEQTYATPLIIAEISQKLVRN